MNDAKEGLGCVCEKGAEAVQLCGCRATQSPRGRVESNKARCLSAVSAGSACVSSGVHPSASTTTIQITPYRLSVPYHHDLQKWGSPTGTST